jgi:hypothetical protein
VLNPPSHLCGVGRLGLDVQCVFTSIYARQVGDKAWSGLFVAWNGRRLIPVLSDYRLDYRRDRKGNWLSSA